MAYPLFNKLLESDQPAFLSNFSFNILKMNDTCRSFFTHYIAGFKDNSQFKFKTINISNVSFQETLLKKNKWKGTLLLNSNQSEPYYLDVVIKLIIENSSNYLVISFDNPEVIKRSGDTNLLFKNHFSKILNSSSEGYVLMNKNYIIDSINKVGQKLSTITHGKSMQVGHCMFEYLPKEAHQYCIDISEKVFSGEKIKIISEYPGIKDKKTYLETEYIPAYDNNKNVIGIIIHVVNITDKHYIKLSLEQSAFRMQSILNSTTEGLAMIGLDHKIILFNEKMAYFVKYFFKITTTPSIKDNFFNYVKKERHEYITQVFERVIKGEKIDIQQEFSGKWMLASYTPIYDKSKTVIAVCISIREITEVINKQSLIKEREELYNTTLNNLSDAVILLDHTFRVIHLNNTAETLLDLLKVDLKGNFKFSASKFGFKTINETDAIYLSPNYLKQTGVKKKDLLVYRNIDYKRDVYLTNISKVNVEKNNLQYLITFKDISNIEEMSEKINQLSLIARNISNGVIITDKKGIIQWVNNAFTNITHYKYEDAVGNFAPKLLEGPDTNPVVTKMMQDNIKKKTAFNCELINYTKEGVKIWLDISVQPMIDKNGKLAQVYILQTDITKRKELELQLEIEKQEHLQNITRAIYTAAENERAYLSKELHDSVNQKLTATLFNLKRIAKSLAEESDLLNHSVELIHDSMNEIRDLSRNLVGKELLRIDFEEAINQIVYTTTESLQDFKYVLDIDKECNQLINNDLKVNIYRIIQEQMQNIIKHSNATNVKLEASIMKGNMLKLVTTDNGKGFNIKLKQNGIGIINIKNRVTSFNGSCEIITSPKHGCKYNIEISL